MITVKLRIVLFMFLQFLCLINSIESEQTNKLNLKKIDKALFYYIKYHQEIQSLSSLNSDPDNVLTRFMQIHDELLNLFSGNSVIEMKMVNKLLEVLQESVQKIYLVKVIRNRPFRWGK